MREDTANLRNSRCRLALVQCGAGQTCFMASMLPPAGGELRNTLAQARLTSRRGSP